MSLQQYVRQVKPRNETYTPPIDKIQKYFDESVEKLPQDKVIDVDSLVSAEKSAGSTQMYEAAGVIVGMEGLELTGEKLTIKELSESMTEIYLNFESYVARLNKISLPIM